MIGLPPLSTVSPSSWHLADFNPGWSDFVWVKLVSKDEPYLAYLTRDHNGMIFQNPGTVGDSEGLSIEYYHDVTHWHELEPPIFR